MLATSGTVCVSNKFCATRYIRIGHHHACFICTEQGFLHGQVPGFDYKREPKIAEERLVQAQWAYHFEMTKRTYMAYRFLVATRAALAHYNLQLLRTQR